MEIKEYQGKTLGDAITEACADLGITSDKLKYETVQEGNNGFLGLGIGAKKYIIRVKDNKNDAAVSAVTADKNSVSEKKQYNVANSDDVKSEHSESADYHKKDKYSDKKNEKSSGGKAYTSEHSAEGNKHDRQDNGQRTDRKLDQKKKSYRSSISDPAAAENNPDEKNVNAAQGSGAGSELREYKDNKTAGRNRSDNERARRNGRDNDRKLGRGPRNSERRSNTDQRSSALSEKKFTHGGYAENFNKNDPDDRQQRSEAVRKYEKTGTVSGDPVKAAEEFLTALFKSMEMNISYRGEFKPENNELIVDLSGEDMGVLIGKRGQTLDALQYLTSQVVNKHETAYVRVKIDTENYRERRRETMETLAQNIAQKVKRTHKPVALEPMNPYERRIIHSILQSEKDVITRSEGVEPYRHVIVCPAKKKRERFAARTVQAETTAADEDMISSKVSVEENVQESMAVEETAKKTFMAEEVIKEQIITEEVISAAAETENSEV